MQPGGKRAVRSQIEFSDRLLVVLLADALFFVSLFAYWAASSVR